MTSQENRDSILADAEEAQRCGARQSRIGQVIGLSSRTLQRWQKKIPDQRPIANRSSPKALSEKEKELIVQTCNRHEFKDMTPNKIVPILAQRGEYIASESMFYKVLKQQKQLTHRSNSKAPRQPVKPQTLVATGPNQVLSWDITYLRTSLKGIFLYLYLFMDVFSRKIMGWRIEEIESGEIAKQAVEQICLENDLSGIHLHSDNGAPMKCGTLLATFQFLGIIASYSRPSVSNDNAYSESLFKTFKYRPGFPSFFENIEEAREWTAGFVNWYNTEHLHSGIRFVTPEQRHTGADKAILETRNKTYLEAKKLNPHRWVGLTRNWSYIDTVELKGSSKLIEARRLA